MVHEKKGLSTRLMFVSVLALVVGCVTLASLLAIGSRMRQQVLTDFSSDLVHSVDTFQSFESQRLASLQRENALLADLPSLKALMTTSDERTIADGAVQFWKVGDNDLFALASSDGRVVAAYTRDMQADPGLRANLEGVLSATGKHYLVSGGRLFEYSVRPLYFGSESAGTLLGYVIGGYAVDEAFLNVVRHSSDADITFLAGDQVLATTLQAAARKGLGGSRGPVGRGGAPAIVALNGQRYLAAADDLSRDASGPLRLVVMKPFDHAERSQREINRLLMLVGFLALFSGTALMVAVSGIVTGPLELLVRSVRAFGSGDSVAALPSRGTREVRELSAAFAAMRDQIQQKSRALLESERLATIGRMASSVSHDLRHYLAAVYANAEFLSSSRLSNEERAELFAEIRMAVHGTTDLIDSLLIFSRTNGTPVRTAEPVAALVERAAALVRTHPEAQAVCLAVVCSHPGKTVSWIDEKQVGRAVYNLLLNACQAARRSAGEPAVMAKVDSSDKLVTVTISDNGVGVLDSIRDSLFDPFVSAGKQNGTGLGLTLAQCVAEEHGGAVRLVRSVPGETLFELSVARGVAEARPLPIDRSAEVAR